MNRRAQTGSGLIESLISIMVVSVGFLGFAGLQTQRTHRCQRFAVSQQGRLPVVSDGGSRPRESACGGHRRVQRLHEPDPAVPRVHGDRELHTGANGEQRLRRMADRSSVASVLPSGAGVICLDSTPDADTRTRPPPARWHGNVLPSRCGGPRRVAAPLRTVSGHERDGRPERNTAPHRFVSTISGHEHSGVHAGWGSSS